MNNNTYNTTTRYDLISYPVVALNRVQVGPRIVIAPRAAKCARHCGPRRGKKIKKIRYKD